MSAKGSVALATLAGIVSAMMLDNAKPRTKVYLRHLNKEVKSSLKEPDLEGFENVEAKHYREITLADVLSLIIDEESALIVMARSSCPWSQKALPILDEILAKNDEICYYVDADSDANKNPVIRKALIKDFAAFLKADEFGEQQLYVPCFITLNKGQVLGVQVGTLGFEPKPLDLDREEEKNELSKRYLEMIQKYKEEVKK